MLTPRDCSTLGIGYYITMKITFSFMYRPRDWKFNGLFPMASPFHLDLDIVEERFREKKNMHTKQLLSMHIQQALGLYIT